MKPIQHMTPVAERHLTPGLTEGDVGASLPVQPGMLLVKEGVRCHDKRPKANDRGGIHKLVVVETKQVFGIAEQNLDVQTGGAMIDQGDRIGIKKKYALEFGVLLYTGGWGMLGELVSGYRRSDGTGTLIKGHDSFRSLIIRRYLRVNLEPRSVHVTRTRMYRPADYML